MGIERIANALGSACQPVVDEVKKDKAYAVAASLYITARFLDGYTTYLGYVLFEEVGEWNWYIDDLVASVGNPEGLILGMGVTSLVALSMTKILNDGFKWTKHWGTIGLLTMSLIAGHSAVNNWHTYQTSQPYVENVSRGLLPPGQEKE